MKLADYVIKFLARQGVGEVFLITGGAIAHLVDAMAKTRGLRYVCTQHEQAAAMAAEAYSRLHPSELGVAMGTSGPGATNLITGICCAYFDSIPTLFITGQVNRFESKQGSAVRQVGFQETEIVPVVKAITKYAAYVGRPEDIRYHLERAVWEARSGRPGPVLVDIPMNVQRAQVNEARLQRFTPPRLPLDPRPRLTRKVARTAAWLQAAKRPLLLSGAGIRLSHCLPEFLALVAELQVPVVPSWAGTDLVWDGHPLKVGLAGVYGSRAANFAVQSADLIVALGTRIDTRLTGGRPQEFGRQSKIVVVDIDRAELDKNRITTALKVHADVSEFIAALRQKLRGYRPRPELVAWRNWIAERQARYPMVLTRYRRERRFVNPYHFMAVLSQQQRPGDVVITDCGANLTWTMQAFRVKPRQRLISTFGNSPMGYSLPAAIGASIARGKAPVTCIIGDGGLQINIQELMTVVHWRLPIKIFVLNNRGYGIIKQFQSMYFGKRYEAVDPASGVGVPDFVKIAKAYGLAATSMRSHRGLAAAIARVLRRRGPILCDVRIDPEAKLTPKLEFGRPIEDLSPLLPRRELAENLALP